MPLLYFNTETTGQNPMESELIIMGLMTPAGKQILIKDPKILEALKPKLENNVIVGCNLKPDLKFLRHKYGITVKNIYDIYIAELILSNGKAGSMYKDIVAKYCDPVDLSTKEPEEFMLNALKYLPEIMQQQQAKIKLLGLENIIEREMKEIPAIIELELSNSTIGKKKLTFLEMILRDNIDMEGLDLLGCCRVLMYNHPELRKKSCKDAAQDMIFMHPHLEDRYPKSEIEEAFKAC